MKAFLYKAKGAVAFTVAMSLFGTQAFAVEALSAEEQGVKAAITVVEEEAPLPQLTLEEAITKAKKHSPTLRDLEATADFLQESREILWDRLGSYNTPSYDYKVWVSDGWYSVMTSLFTLNSSAEQTSVGKKVAVLGVEVSVRNYFNLIVEDEDSLELLKVNADIQKRLYEQGQTKHRLGMLSTYELDKLKVAAEQAAANVTLVQENLEQYYTNLNNLMGVDADNRYELVYEAEFTPYTMTQTMDQYINDQIKNNDLSIQQLELFAESAKFNMNYRPESDSNIAPNQEEFDYNEAKRSLKTAKENKAALIRNTYSQIQQLETQYASAQSDLAKAQADYRAVQVNYQAGNVTKITVEQAEMAVISAENALHQLEHNHDMLIFMFENPTLLSEY